MEPVRKAVCCPLCGVESIRVHSRYQRSARDLPWSKWPVVLIVHSRKFFCDNEYCPRRIFTEPFPNVLERYAKRTERLCKALLELAYASSAEAAARAAVVLGYPVSGDSLINWQRQENFVIPTPRVLGVDEFSLRRGQTYGTILVDLERHHAIDVLEGKEAGPLTRWLRQHPGVEVLSRDRADAYAMAGRMGAPNALQVADRFHLVKNVSDALKELLSSRRWEMPEVENVLTGNANTPENTGGDMSPKLPIHSTRKLALWEAVQAEKAKGKFIRAIARELGIHRRTVRKYIDLDHPPVYRSRKPRQTKLAPYMSYLQQRWNDGCHNARVLAEELMERGYKGGYTQIKDTVRSWRSKEKEPEVPSVRRKIQPFRPWLVIRPYRKLSDSERQELGKVFDINSALAEGHRLKEGFGRILTQRDVNALDIWLKDAYESGLKPFQSLAKGIHKDIDAVRLALVLPWSNAQCEGQNCRIKMIKRQGYGRAKFDLLRKRILHRVRAA